MNAKLSLLQRRMDRQSLEQAPAPASDDLAAAIERLIEQRVDQAMEQRPVKTPAHLQRIRDQFDAPKPYTDFKQLPPVAKAPAPKAMEMRLHRDGAGVVRWMEINGVKIEALRDRAGVLLGARQVDESPVLPPLDIADKAQARKYKEGV